MTLNDLECPIHLKVRFTDGTLDVRTLWLSDSTIRIGIARGERRESGLEGLAPPLPPCGQLTRCFSAVAELLVFTLLNVPSQLYNSAVFRIFTANYIPYSLIPICKG